MKEYTMYIDDIRTPRGDFTMVIKTSSDAITTMRKQGCPVFISFDHDLGGDDTSMLVVKWMIEQDLNTRGDFIPSCFEYNVHSANPVGAENIIGTLKGYLKHKESTRITAITAGS